MSGLIDPEAGPTPHAADAADEEARVVRAVPALRPGQAVAATVALLCAGVMFARGFIGIVPGRPVYIVLGVAVAASALWSLTIDHVAIRPTRERPDQVLSDELDRSRRYGHPLTLVRIRCDEATGAAVSREMRSCDRAWRRRGEQVVLLVETGRAGAQDLVDRISHPVPASDIRTATFPDDALTVEALYRVGSGRRDLREAAS